MKKSKLKNKQKTSKEFKNKTDFTAVVELK